MKRLLLLMATCGMVMLVASPAFAQDEFDCDDFATQEEAQQVFDADPSDPSGLDGPPGDAFTGEEGVACEELPSGGSTDDDDPTEEQYAPDEQYESDDELLEAGGDLPEASQTMAALPDTGGPSMLLPMGALVFGAGILGYAVIRRS